MFQILLIFAIHFHVQLSHHDALSGKQIWQTSNRFAPKPDSDLPLPGFHARRWPGPDFEARELTHPLEGTLKYKTIYTLL